MRLLISEAQFYKSRYNALIPVECKNCKRRFKKKKKFVARMLHGKLRKVFCRYCSEKQRFNTSSGTRSKAEVLICALIMHEFPNLDVKFNDRKQLPSGLELDIYIPDYKFAIEVNGIFHYEAIHGEDRLARVVKRDLAKKEEAKSLGIRLLIIDTHIVENKLLKGYLKTQYRQQIRPILKNSISEYFALQVGLNPLSIACS